MAASGGDGGLKRIMAYATELLLILTGAFLSFPWQTCAASQSRSSKLTRQLSEGGRGKEASATIGRALAPPLGRALAPRAVFPSSR